MMTPATAEQPLSSVTADLLLLLQVVGRGRGVLRLDAWTLHGFGHQMPELRPPFDALPEHLLGLLQDGWGITFAPALREGGTLSSVAVLWATLARPPLPVLPFGPSATFEAGRAATVVWALRDSLDLRDPVVRAHAAELQRRLAVTCGSDVGASALEAMIALPGSVCRNAGDPPPPVRFLEIVPERIYTTQQIEEALP